jgi:hypothetical protein
MNTRYTHNMNSLTVGLETAADKVLTYMAANKLVANPKKTKFLLMRGKHHKKWPETRIRVGGDSVKESTHERLLGVTVSNNLKWKDHRPPPTTCLQLKTYGLWDKKTHPELTKAGHSGTPGWACPLISKVLFATLWFHETK